MASLAKSHKKEGHKKEGHKKEGHKKEGVEINKDDTLIPFLFMGCWNRDAPPRKSVAEAIMSNPIKKLILGGDNVYPEKIKLGNSTDFTKVYSLKTLMDGIHMLYGKEIYAALGNHNVSKPILKTQLGLSNWTLPSRYYSIKFKDYSLIVIDTNLIGTDEENSMFEWLSKKVNELKVAQKSYYYVQHDPFMSFKKIKLTELPKIFELLSILSSYPPQAILCADTHNFQKGILNIKGIHIPQFIVGTGGADPDYITPPAQYIQPSGDYSFKSIDGNITYTMKSYRTKYGYLEVKSAKPKFIEVEDWRPFEGVETDTKNGGRRHKTHKKKNRKSRKSRKSRKLKH